MIRKFKKRIDDDIVSLVECSNYVVDGSRNVIVQLLSNKNIKLNDELFNKYISKYEEDYISYEIIKNQIDYEYVSDLIESFNLKNLNWTLTYATKELYITIDYDEIDKDMHADLDEYLQLMGFIETHGYRS